MHCEIASSFQVFKRKYPTSFCRLGVVGRGVYSQPSIILRFTNSLWIWPQWGNLHFPWTSCPAVKSLGYILVHLVRIPVYHTLLLECREPSLLSSTCSFSTTTGWTTLQFKTTGVIIKINEGFDHMHGSYAISNVKIYILQSYR